MDRLSSLPPELLGLVLDHLPSSKNLRLASRALSQSPILFTHTFSDLLHTWLCEKASYSRISEVASDLMNRPAVMWSPLVVEFDVDEEEHRDADMEVMCKRVGDDGGNDNSNGNGNETQTRKEIEMGTVTGTVTRSQNVGREEQRETREALFLGIVWRLLLGYCHSLLRSEGGTSDGEDVEGKGRSEGLTMENFAAKSGLERFTGKMLRMGRTRFLLHMKLMREGSW